METSSVGRGRIEWKNWAGTRPSWTVEPQRKDGIKSIYQNPSNYRYKMFRVSILCGPKENHYTCRRPAASTTATATTAIRENIATC